MATEGVVHALRAVHRALRLGGLLLDIHAARAALASLVETGWFAREREVAYEWVQHAPSVDAWLAYRAAKGVSVAIDPALLARARAFLAQGGSDLCLREHVTATRLRRLARA